MTSHLALSWGPSDAPLCTAAETGRIWHSMRAIDGALDVPAPWKAVKTRTPLTDPEIVHEVLAQGWNRTDTTNEPIPTLGLRLSATAGTLLWSVNRLPGRIGARGVGRCLGRRSA